jgi:transcriptional/translational regulatory protein YebC/TACO1
VSVSLPTLSDNQEGEPEPSDDESVDQAKHEAAEIVARARRQAEEIVAEARGQGGTPSPLAALGDNAEEIIGQVRKLIKKQRQLQDERQAMEEEIAGLKAERDELVQRLTDAVVRMEELAQMADTAQSAPRPPQPPAPVDTEPTRETTSLAARLEAAERAEREDAARREAAEESEGEPAARPLRTLSENPDDDDDAQFLIGNDGRSFYSRHSAKLPRLEGDGGRSALSVIGDMRPDPDPKARKGRRRRKNG